jgi:hypothetical protein
VRPLSPGIAAGFMNIPPAPSMLRGEVEIPTARPALVRPPIAPAPLRDERRPLDDPSWAKSWNRCQFHKFTSPATSGVPKSEDHVTAPASPDTGPAPSGPIHSIYRSAPRPPDKARCVSTRSASRDDRPRRQSRSMRAPTARRSSVASLVSPSSPTRTTSAPTSGTRISEGEDCAARSRVCQRNIASRDRSRSVHGE